MRNFRNFTSSVADWTLCEEPDRPPDYYSFCGSAYWDYGDRVRRLSNHWGQLRRSKWLLNGKESNVYCCGECYYEEFRSLRCLLDDESQWPSAPGVQDRQGVRRGASRVSGRERENRRLSESARQHRVL